MSRVKGEANSRRNQLMVSIASFSTIVTSLFALFAVSGINANTLRPIGYYFISVSYIYMGIVSLALVYHRDSLCIHSYSKAAEPEFDPTQLVHALHFLVVAAAAFFLAFELSTTAPWFAIPLGSIGITFVFSSISALFTHKATAAIQRGQIPGYRKQTDEEKIKTVDEKKSSWTRFSLAMAALGFTAGIITFIVVWDSIERVESLGTAILLVSAVSSAIAAFRSYEALTKAYLADRELDWLRQNILLDGIEEGEVRRRYEDVCLLTKNRVRTSRSAPLLRPMPPACPTLEPMKNDEQSISPMTRCR